MATYSGCTFWKYSYFIIWKAITVRVIVISHSVAGFLVISIGLVGSTGHHWTIIIVCIRKMDNSCFLDYSVMNCVHWCRTGQGLLPRMVRNILFVIQLVAVVLPQALKCYTMNSNRTVDKAVFWVGGQFIMVNVFFPNWRVVHCGPQGISGC